MPTWTCPECDSVIDADALARGECDDCGAVIEGPSRWELWVTRLIGDRTFKLPDAKGMAKFLRRLIPVAIVLFVLVHVPLLAPRWILNEPALRPVPCADPCPLPLNAGLLSETHATLLANRISPLADRHIYVAVQGTAPVADLTLRLTAEGQRITLRQRDDTRFWSVDGAHGGGAVSVNVADTTYVPLQLDGEVPQSFELRVIGGKDNTTPTAPTTPTTPVVPPTQPLPTTPTPAARTVLLPVVEVKGALDSMRPEGWWLLLLVAIAACWGFLRAGPELLRILSVGAVSMWLAMFSVAVGRSRLLNNIGSYAGTPHYPAFLAVFVTVLVFALSVAAPILLIIVGERSTSVKRVLEPITGPRKTPGGALAQKLASSVLMVATVFLLFDLLAYSLEVLLPGWRV